MYVYTQHSIKYIYIYIIHRIKNKTVKISENPVEIRLSEVRLSEERAAPADGYKC